MLVIMRIFRNSALSSVQPCSIRGADQAVRLLCECACVCEHVCVCTGMGAMRPLNLPVRS